MLTIILSEEYDVIIISIYVYSIRVMCICFGCTPLHSDRDVRSSPPNFLTQPLRTSRIYLIFRLFLGD